VTPNQSRQRFPQPSSRQIHLPLVQQVVNLLQQLRRIIPHPRSGMRREESVEGVDIRRVDAVDTVIPHNRHFR
jgi:hypothetical protein